MKGGQELTKKSRKAFAYVRAFPDETAEADKGSVQRQRTAIAAYASAAGLESSPSFAIRPSLAQIPSPIGRVSPRCSPGLESNNAKTIIVHDPEHLARGLIMHLDGYDWLKEQGITVVAASAPAYFLRHSPGYFCNTFGRSAPGPVRSSQ